MHTLGGLAAGWIEYYLRHGPGDVQGNEIELTPEELGFLDRAYRLRPLPRCVECSKRTEDSVLDEQEADGRPWECRHCRERLPVRKATHRYMLSRPKGWSKSGRAGEVACFDALGESRFDGWDADGHPVGAPIVSPEVLCLATEETQSGHTYDVIYTNLHQASCSDEIAEDYPGIDVGITRILLPDGGEITPVTSGASSKDGGKSTFVVFDEPHLWYTPELVRLYHTVRRNLGKRKAADPWALLTSTMYRPGQNSVAELLHDEARRSPAGMVWDHRESSVSLPDALSEAEKSGDDQPLIDALHEAFGDAASRMDTARIISEELRSASVDPEDAERYWLNRRVQHRSNWIDPKHVESITVPNVNVLSKDRITLGFDGSEGTDGANARKADSTVLRGCRISDGTLFTVGMWEHPDEVLAWEPPRTEIVDTCRDAFDRYDVVRMYMDPPGWRTEYDTLAAEFGTDRVAQFWTLNDGRMGGALDRLRTAIRAANKLPESSEAWAVRFQPDEDVHRHYANARTYSKRRRAADDPDGRKELVLVRKEHPNSALKIDAVVSDALAYEARAHVLLAGQGEAEAPREPARLVSY